MKLSDHHSCESFDDGKPISIETATLFRECMDRSIINTKENCAIVVSFAQILMEQTKISGLECLSPLVLHCLYRASVALSWMAMESGDEQYIAGRAICEETLRMICARWKGAGIVFCPWLPYCSGSICLIFLTATYLKLLNVAEKEMRRVAL
jgi:hypothetical protein